ATQDRREGAQDWYVRAIEDDPHRVDTYNRLARLRRSELRQDQLADEAIRDMIAKNPQSGRAYAYQWRYKRELEAPAGDTDITKALQPSPQDRQRPPSADPGRGPTGAAPPRRPHRRHGSLSESPQPAPRTAP